MPSTQWDWTLGFGLCGSEGGGQWRTVLSDRQCDNGDVAFIQVG